MIKDFEFDEKTRNILNNKMALALIKMLYVKDLITSKEFNDEGLIQNIVNDWLYENQDKKIIDIKYSADQYCSNVLIVYEED